MYNNLAAIHFDEEQDIDLLLAAFVQRKRASGLKVMGVLQSRGDAGGECHCTDMDLRVIGSSTTFRISQALGRGSSGCRLHPGALADCCVYLEHQLQAGADLLVLNRFGKGESDGRGFRDLIYLALALDIPVLTAVRPTYLAAWHEFCDGCGQLLPPSLEHVQDWSNQLPPATIRSAQLPVSSSRLDAW